MSDAFSQLGLSRFQFQYFPESGMTTYSSGTRLLVKFCLVSYKGQLCCEVTTYKWSWGNLDPHPVQDPEATKIRQYYFARTDPVSVAGTLRELYKTELHDAMHREADMYYQKTVPWLNNTTIFNEQAKKQAEQNWGNAE